MSVRTASRSTVTLLMAAMLCLTARQTSAQKSEGAATPRADWTPRMLSDGQPDITGRWRAEEGGTYDTTAVESGGGIFQRLVDTAAGRPSAPRPSRVVDPSDGQIPYQPWARAKQQDVQTHADNPITRQHIDPRARCLPGGVPREAFPTGFRFLQVPGYVIFLGEQKSVTRIIPLDDRPFIDDRIKLWMGDSRGHWEGTTLIVEVRNQNSKGRFDMMGNFASDRVRVVERWTIVSERELDYRATIEDPSVYTRPWTIASKILRSRPSKDEYGDELWEDACHEGERSADEMVLSPEAVAAAGGPQ